MSQFYALMSDNTVKIIALDQNVIDEVRDIFIQAEKSLKPNNIEEDLFDGNILARNGENITYVNFELPDDFRRIPDNQADITDFIITEDKPKSIFWYENGKYLFQVFNKRNLLQRKTVLKIERGNTFAKLNESAFIIDDKIHAIYENGRLYFQSYTSANQIFSLIDFVTEATNGEIESFGEIEGINVNTAQIKDIANVKTRRLIKVLSSTNNINVFMTKALQTRKQLLTRFHINASFNENHELMLPTNNVAALNRTLEFLNEDIFKGIITNSLYRSNSKKKDS